MSWRSAIIAPTSPAPGRHGQSRTSRPSQSGVASLRAVSPGATDDQHVGRIHQQRTVEGGGDRPLAARPARGPTRRRRRRASSVDAARGRATLGYGDDEADARVRDSAIDRERRRHRRGGTGVTLAASSARRDDDRRRAVVPGSRRTTRYAPPTGPWTTSASMPSRSHCSCTARRPLTIAADSVVVARDTERRDVAPVVAEERAGGGSAGPLRLIVLRRAEDQVVVLRPVEAVAEPAESSTSERRSTDRWHVYIDERNRSGDQPGLRKCAASRPSASTCASSVYT